MTSQRLRKYLTYYQNLLRDDPEHIEARLRLAAIFRDMGRKAHAIDEYATASRLLAREGLALEAIAACKTILELDPQHTQTQLFLARMYAQAPEIAGQNARIARPVQGAVRAAQPAAPPNNSQPTTMAAPIELRTPKGSKRPAEAQDVTVVGEASPELRALLAEEESLAESVKKGAEDVTLETENVRHTVEMEASERVAVLRQLYHNVLAEEEDAEPTGVHPRVELGSADPTDELDKPDIILEDEPGSTPAELSGAQAQLRESAEVILDDPISDELSAYPGEGKETFEATVFDMASLNLEEELSERWEDLSFLDDIEEPETQEVFSAAGLLAEHSAPVLSVNRADLPRIPLFSQLNPAAFTQLLTLMDYRVLPAGTTVIEPGRTGNSLYVIVDGQVSVMRTLDDGRRVALAEIKEGEFFGEFALLTGESQSADVVATTDLTVLQVSREVLQLVAEEHPEIWDILWEFYYARVLNNLLATSQIFRSMSERERQLMAARFVLREVPKGELIAQKGQVDEDLYVICFGEVRVERQGAEDEPSGLIDMLGPGEFVGLISSTNQRPVVADLRASEDTTLLVLPGEDFRRALSRWPQVEEEVLAVVRRRIDATHQLTSGATSYAKFGVAADQADSAASRGSRESK